MREYVTKESAKACEVIYIHDSINKDNGITLEYLKKLEDKMRYCFDGDYIGFNIIYDYAPPKNGLE